MILAMKRRPEENMTLETITNEITCNDATKITDLEDASTFIQPFASVVNVPGKLRQFRDSIFSCSYETKVLTFTSK